MARWKAASRAGDARKPAALRDGVAMAIGCPWAGETAPIISGRPVGRNGTGDSMNKQIMTRESLLGMLERLGVNARTANNDIRTKNVAAVIVTATLPPFAQQGTRIDVTVGTLGDATSLQGAV